MTSEREPGTPQEPSATAAAAEPAPPASGPSRPTLPTPAAAGLLAVAAGVAAWPLLSWDPRDEIQGSTEGLEGWFFSTVGAAPALTLGLALWLLWNRRAALVVWRGGAPGGRAAALAFALPALAFQAWSAHVGAPELVVPALALWVLALGWAFGGSRSLRVLWFPALFLLLAHPLPVAFVNWVLYPMQRLTADWASFHLSLLGIPHVQSGELLRTATAQFQVIETCAGLRSLETMLLGLALYLELFYRSRRQALWLGLATLPIAVITNQLRVMTIILNPYSDISTVHSLQGMAMLSGGIFALAGVDWVESRLGGRRVRPGWPHERSPQRVAAVPVVAAAGLWAALAGASLALPAWEPPRAVDRSLTVLPGQLDGWKPSGLKLDDTFLGSARVSEWVHRRYRKDDQEIDVFLAGRLRRERFHCLISPKLSLPGSGWYEVAREETRLPGAGPEASWRLQRLGSQLALSLYWTEGQSALPVEILRSALVLDRGPTARPGREVALRFTTPLRDESEVEAAKERLLAFALRARRALAERRALPPLPGDAGGPEEG